MDALWLKIIEQSIGKVQRTRALSGGDTSSIYEVELKTITLITKTNSDANTPVYFMRNDWGWKL
ncbi:MAG: hypothetical protein AAFZ63_14705 [Bacteroidota bacterium]